MKLFALCVLVAVLTGLGVVAYAQNQTLKKRGGEAELVSTGNDIYKFCKSYKGGEVDGDTVACAAYIEGVTETLLLNDDTETLMKSPCPGKYVTREQVIDVVVKWLNDHPEKRDGPAPAIVVRALNEAFPCE